MVYEKAPISIADQICKLKERGLRFADDKTAELILSSVSYYRLRAYTYPFQDNKYPDHLFIKDISFEEVFALYKFDHLLRVIVFNMLGVVEVAFRTQIIYNLALHYGSHWQLNSDLYRNRDKLELHLASLQTEISRSTECFIDHYKRTYNEPASPPSWMSLEVASFGLLSKIFQNLKKCDAKNEITRYFGVRDVSIIENWMLCFSNLRNICAHHSRLRNRRFTAKPKLPMKPIGCFAQTAHNAHPNKLYPVLCCLLYIIDKIRPDHDYKDQLKSLFLTCPLGQLKEMGFPSNWANDIFWE